MEEYKIIKKEKKEEKLLNERALNKEECLHFS